jgi:hypothetical protein
MKPELQMKRHVALVIALFVLSVPTALAAPPEGKGRPDNPGNSAAAPGQSADKNAAKKCKAMRANNRAAFEQQYGTKPNAFGKCVSAQSKAEPKPDEPVSPEELQEARENAAKKCKKLLSEMGVAKFREEYGTNANGANAFGKCVSKHARKILDS